MVSELRATRFALLIAIVAGGAGCSRDPDGRAAPSPLVHADDPAAVPVDVARAATDPAELLRALNRPGAAAALGAFRMTGTASTEVLQSGRSLEKLEEEVAIERQAGGDYHARYKNARDYGREIYWLGGKLLIRPGFGKFHRREPTSAEEPGRLLDESFGTLGAQLEVVAGSLAVSDAGETIVAGRPGRKITLAVGAKRSQPASQLPQRAWREEITVQALVGEVVLDAETGALLAGNLSATLAFLRDGQSFEMRLDSRHAVEAVGGEIAVAVPAEEEISDTPRRSAEQAERDQLLEGLAPPSSARAKGAPKASP